MFRRMFYVGCLRIAAVRRMHRLGICSRIVVARAKQHAPDAHGRYANSLHRSLHPIDLLHFGGVPRLPVHTDLLEHRRTTVARRVTLRVEC